MLITINLPNGSKVEKTVHKNVILIGRSNKCDVVVPDESLSRQHCQIEIISGDYFITDLGSANGVYLGGERIEPNTKTPFTSFMQLSIGSLECSVMDLEEHSGGASQSTHHQTSPDLSVDQNTRTIIKKPRPERSSPSPQRSSSSSRSQSDKQPLNPKLMGVGLLVLLVALGYYKMSGSPEEITSVDSGPTSSKGPTAAPVPPRKRNIMVPDEFASAAGYLETSNRRGCGGHALICKDLELESDGEGIAMEGKEIFVFLNPTSLLELPHFAAIHDLPGAADILAIYYVLKSQTLLEMQQGTYAQIHLVIINNEKAPQKIYRFHPKVFDADGNKKSFLLDRISNAIQNASLETFWTESKPLIPSKTVTEL